MTVSTRLVAVFVVAAMCLNTGFVLAQQDAKPKSTEEKPAEAPLEATSAPYDDKLLRLAQVLGSLHYLRALCGGNEGNKWRDFMSEILVSEEPTAPRKARLVARFNRGYRAFDQIYGICTPSAHLAVDRYMKEGVRLSSQITSRFGR